VGDIMDLASRYRDERADELVFYDITASPEGRSVDREWVRREALVRRFDLYVDLALPWGPRAVVMQKYIGESA
jgi:imidazole glycerol phosphate synthase subunit HisF